MKRKGLAVIVSMLFLMMASTGFAMEIGIKGGIHMPTGDYGDVVDEGYTFGAQLKAPATDILSWGVHVAYTTAMADKKLEGEKVDIDAAMIEVYPFLDFYPVKTDQFDLFLRGGLGFNMWEIEEESKIPGDVTEKDKVDGTDLMIAAGCGINFLRNFELLALYNRVFDSDDDADYFTFTIGYNFDLQR
jgi:hypothetical protein